VLATPSSDNGNKIMKQSLGGQANSKLRMKDPSPSSINLKSTPTVTYALNRNYTDVTYILNVLSNV